MRRMNVDHVGIAVHSLDEALTLYCQVLGLPYPAPDQIEEVKEQKVRVAFIEAGDSRIELLEATAEDSAVAKFIEKRGSGMHHIAFRVSNLIQSLQQAEEAGLTLVDREPRRGACGHLVAFLHPQSTGGVLIELCQEEV